MSRRINRIVIHCSATRQSATPEAILRYWKTPRGPKGSRYIPGKQGGLGWRHPGYHAIIPADGSMFIYADSDTITNGVRFWNNDSLHICYIGGKNGDDRTPAQKHTMLALIKQLTHPSRLGKIPVVGHRDLSPDKDGNGVIENHEWLKRCPSFNVETWLVENGLSYLWPQSLLDR